MYLNCNAVVLRKYRYSETSYILHLFTREYGRVNALAKGARRIKSNMYSHFDLYNLEEITLFRRRRSDLDVATSAALLQEFRAIRKSVSVYAGAGLLAEIILKSCMLHDKHTLAFDAFTGFLRNSESVVRNKVFSELITAIWIIISDLGFEPFLDRCMQCGKENVGEFTLHPQSGGIVCVECLQVAAIERLNAGILAGLRGISSGQFGKKISLTVNVRLLNVLSKYINYHLEAECSSFSFLKSLVV